MALNQIVIVANQIEAQRLGYQGISLTHFADLLECKIAAGSVVEIGSALFEAAVDESIAGWAGIAINNDVYIKLTVAGASATASFTTVAPTWDTAKQGWYIGGTERVIGGLYKDAGSNYTDKWLYAGGPEIRYAQLGADSVRTAAIQDAAVVPDKVDFSLIADDTQVVPDAATVGLGAGIYSIAVSNAFGFIEIKVGGVWYAINAVGHGASVISAGGTTARIHSSGGACTFYIRKWT